MSEILLSSEMIVRKVKVDRNRTPQEALDATGCVQDTNREVVNSMPKSESNEVEVVFFKPDLSKLGGYLEDEDLVEEFELRGLKPADPIAVAALNEADPDFADTHPNGTRWEYEDGSSCYVAFFHYRDGRRNVTVFQEVYYWCENYWLAGIPK